MVAVKEFISIFERMDGGEISEKSPKLCPCLGLREGPEPRETLPYDVVEAALDQGPGPDQSNRPHHGLLSIHGDTKGVKALDLKCLKPRKNAFEALFGTVGMTDDLLAPSLHKADVAAVSVKVSPVIEEVTVLRIIPRFFGRLLKPVILNLLKLETAVAREIRKLSDGIAFLGPELKPMPLAKPLILRPFPDEGLETLKTSKSLLLLFGFSIALYSERLTLGTMLFLTSSAPCLLNRFN